MDIIDEVLSTASDPSYVQSAAIRTALTIGKKTLSKYYNKTGESEVYRIAMSTSVAFFESMLFLTSILVLHPRNKLEYFKNKKWDEPSIEAAHALIQDKFNRSYREPDVEENDGTTPTHTNIAVSHSILIPKSRRKCQHFYVHRLQH